MAKHWLPWVVKFALSGALIWYVLKDVDLGEAWARASGISPELLILAAIMFFGNVVIGTLRWQMVLRAIGASLPLSKTFTFFYSGVFFSIALPGAVGGDAVRMWMARKAGLELGQAVNSVMLERVAQVLGLVLLVACVQPILLARIGDIPGSWVFPALSVAGLGGTGVLMLLDRLPEQLRQWRVIRGLAQLASDTRKLFLRPRRSIPTLMLAVLAHANLSLATWVMALGLDIQVSAIDCIALVPPVILIMTLPISIAGWGVRETAMVVAFGFVGVESHAALVLSILFGLVNMAVSLPGGLVWLASRGDAPDAQPLSTRG
jgi:uncharacterized membrane protein YbhN (UPF0104 family)